MISRLTDNLCKTKDVWEGFVGTMGIVLIVMIAMAFGILLFLDSV